jgi:hypothetical protein
LKGLHRSPRITTSAQKRRGGVLMKGVHVDQRTGLHMGAFMPNSSDKERSRHTD